MEDELTEFLWRVPSAGHYWIEGEPVEDGQQPTNRFLIGDAAPGQIAYVSEYNPLRTHNGLFRTFAETKTSEEGIVEFANRFGCLGGDVRVTVLVKTPDGAEVMRDGELQDKWEDEILTMRILIKIWELAKKRDEVGLGKFIQWKHDAIHFLLPPLHSASAGRPRVIAAMQIPPNFRNGDTVMPARCFLQKRVNEKLHGVRASLLWNVKQTELGLRLVPQSLIGCLWLQFAKAIEGNKNYQQCGNCQGWFEIGGSRGARADKKFCSPSCKASAHRKKREEALRLFLGRVPVKEIARQLDTDLATVKSWVRK
jgi:hypothetical protein